MVLLLVRVLRDKEMRKSPENIPSILGWYKKVTRSRATQDLLDSTTSPLVAEKDIHINYLNHKTMLYYTY